MLGIDELEVILDEIYNKIRREVTLANRLGIDELNEVLKKYEVQTNNEEQLYIDLDRSKVLIVGNLSASKKDIEGICKSIGIDYDRLAFVDYEQSTNYNYEKLRYSNQYSDVIFGPMPYKAVGIGNNSSVITLLESNPKEYPKAIRAMAGDALKLTKTSIKEALMKTRIYSTLIA